ncbi:MAG: aminoglycoside phosphotransferase family protein [Chloroflexota bacterium]
MLLNLDQVETLLGKRPIKMLPLMGGNSSLVYEVLFADGQRQVLKFAEGDTWLKAEQIFLDAWAKIGIRTPRVYEHGTVPDSPFAYLLMEFVSGQNLFPLLEAETVPCTEVEQDLGHILARMHTEAGHGYGQVQVSEDGSIQGEVESLTDMLVLQEWRDTLSANVAKGYLTSEEVQLAHQAINTLVEHRGKDGGSYTHNDFRAGNILYDPRQAEPYAVIDPGPELNHPYLCLAYSLILTEIHGHIDPAHFRRGYHKISPIDEEALEAAIFLCMLKLLPRWGKPGAQYAEVLQTLFQRKKDKLNRKNTRNNL